MEVVDKSLSITNVINRFSSAVTQRIAKAEPINEIIELIAQNLRIENSSYLVSRAVNKLDRRRRWHDTIRN